MARRDRGLRTHLVAASSLFAALIGCETGAQTPPPKPKPPKPAAAAPAQAAQDIRPIPVDLAQDSSTGTEDFGKQVESAFRRSPSAVRALIDVGAMADEAQMGITVVGDQAAQAAFNLFRKANREVLVASLTNDDDGLFALLVQGVKQGGSLTYLTTVEREGTKRAILRFVAPAGGGVNYFELPMSRVAGKGATDFYPYTALEPLSDTFRRAFLVEMQQKIDSNDLKVKPRFDETPQGKLAKKCYLSLEWTRKLEQLVGDGDWDEVEKVFKQLPTSPLDLKTLKYNESLRLQAAVRSGKKAVLDTAVKDFRKGHKGDPGIEFVAAVGYLNMKAVTEAQGALNELAKVVGEKDANVLAMRATLDHLNDKTASALTNAEKAISADPSLLDAYWTGVAASAKAKDETKAITFLDQVSSQLKVKRDKLSSTPQFKAFNFALDQPSQEWIKNMIAANRDLSTPPG